MSSDAEDIRIRRKALREEYGDLYDRLVELFFRRDLVGINFGDNTDEYEPEVNAILPRLRTCASAQDVQRVAHEEFVQLFNAEIAGPPERYESIAQEIWTMWTDSNIGGRRPTGR